VSARNDSPRLRAVVHEIELAEVARLKVNDNIVSVGAFARSRIHSLYTILIETRFDEEPIEVGCDSIDDTSGELYGVAIRVTYRSDSSSI
jgi:hypothetical protein